MPVREPLVDQRAALKPIATLRCKALHKLLRTSTGGHHRASYGPPFMALLYKHETCSGRYTPQRTHQNPHYYI